MRPSTQNTFSAKDTKFLTEAKLEHLPKSLALKVLFNGTETTVSSNLDMQTQKITSSLKVEKEEEKEEEKGRGEERRRLRGV